MSDDFQRDALAPLMCPRHDCESTRHALNQLRVENKHLRDEIERLRQQRDELLMACREAERAVRNMPGNWPTQLRDILVSVIARAEGRSNG
jgi:ribosomal 50S subunit-associated protein YjgA (DUF615 family)